MKPATIDFMFIQPFRLSVFHSTHHTSSSPSPLCSKRVIRPVTCVLDSNNPSINENTLPSSYFSQAQQFQETNNESFEFSNANGSTSEGYASEEHDTEEMYFKGLSYPSEVLDWCTTQVDDHYAQGNQHICDSTHDSQMKRVERTFVDTFRMSSPYINAYQGSIFVIHIPGALIRENMFAAVMEDIALMRVVGIKLVLVLGPQEIINERLRKDHVTSKFVDGIRITDYKTMQIVKELSGSMRFEVECALAKGVTNMPSYKSISVVSGNFLSAQPIGIIDGQDFGYTGKVRKIDVDSIKKRLDQGDIIILPNVGSSPSGQIFNCKSEEIAAQCSSQLKAEKLIFMGDGETLYDKRSGHAIANLSLKSASRYLRSKQNKKLPHNFKLSLQYSIQALDRGVIRAHILNRSLDGVLLMEIFHRDGAGLMISGDLYEGFRPAKLKDLNGLQAIIKPLQDSGILKYRPKTVLEEDIEKFVVIERDGMIIACLSLTIMDEDPSWAELGCVAVHKNYRKLGKGDAMLGFTERMAYEKGVRNLFILSTQSFDWFNERGFKEVTIHDLPKCRQKNYDQSRRSKIFHKVLQGSRAVDEAEVLKHL